MPRTPGKTSKGPKKGKARGDRANFIRAQPLGMPVAEVQEKGKKIGLKITKNHIYTIRHSMRKGQSASASTAKASAAGRRKATRATEATTAAPVRAPRAPSVQPANGSAAVTRLQVAIMDVGFEKAQEVFDTLKVDLSAFFQTNGARRQQGRGAPLVHAS